MEHGVFSGLGDDDRRALLATMVRRRYARHDTLFHEGDPGDSLHLVDRGRVAIRVTTRLGDVVTVAVLGPGESFGEQALLGDDTRRTASVVALEPVTTRCLFRHDFARLRAEHPSVDRLLVQFLSRDVHRLTNRLLEALYDDVDRRVARRLAELVGVYDGKDGEPVEIPLRQEDLASMAGTTRPTTNRVLRALEDDGVVVLARGRIRVVDRVALEQAAR